MASQEHVDVIRFGVDKWNRWRQQNPSIRPDLNYANLCSQDLRDIDLKRADLSRADLRASDLQNADLTRADLKGADLSESNLTDANLRGADLFDANLEGAILTGVSASGLKIHYDALQFFGEAEKKQYGSSFTLYKLPKDFFDKKQKPLAPSLLEHSASFASNSLEISSEYSKTGLHILNQFVTILNRKYSGEPVKVTLMQNGLKIRMTIDSEGGREEIIEAALDDNSIIAHEELSLEECLQDPDMILELRTEIKEMISNSRDQKKLMEGVCAQLKKTRLVLEKQLDEKK